MLALARDDATMCKRESMRQEKVAGDDLQVSANSYQATCSGLL